MPPRPKTAERSIEKMLTSWAETPKSPRTITHYAGHSAAISRMLGHESIDMTLGYIGVDLDDMNGAMQEFKL